ncbi:ATP-dependent RNA helicase RhlB [hydrothermal vent metagenome]|uniref:ATP-dependent RNA helicase RhlB n=1 Tax=hydrothermal vent metagenome TaxID=652676 RepID=A0A3B0WXS7_9ZZZZ
MLNTMSTHLTDQRFDQYKLPEALLQGLNQAGFTQCTPIQADSLNISLDGQDVAGEAQTGTGKTIAFLVAVYNRLLTQPAPEHRKPNQPRALILAPTRELAIQIHKDAELLGQHTGLKLALIYGGTGYEQQQQSIANGVDILIGTPGRLIDFFKQHFFNLKMIQSLVLDEADRMFDLGFINDIRYLIRRCPEPSQRLSMLFSATLSFRVQELAYEHMNAPKHIKIQSEQRTADKIEESVYYPANDEKIPLLIGLIIKEQPVRSIIFVNTKRVADNINAWLTGNDMPPAILSGDVPQKKRQSLLKKFQDGENLILVATDVAARGLHIPEVSHVFNFDLPQQAEDYVHRIGRTARAGASGTAISFACEDYAHFLPEIEDYIQHSIPSEQVSNELLPALKPKAKVERYGDQKHKHGSRPGNRSKNRNQQGSRHHNRNHSQHKQHNSHQSKKASTDN